jgi:filamentous hemagglutinin
MNQGLYKLVFSKVLNIYVPVSEAVRCQGARNSKRARRLGKSAFTLILIFSSLQAAQSFADTVTAIELQKAVNATVSSTINSTTVNQTAPKAILDWRKLNLGKDYLLNFNQQGNRNWSALNRINDLTPSILNGIVKADGNVYFINANGIIFGNNAQFNVGSLYAGSLDITDNLFNEGLLSKPFAPAFEGVGGFVTVENGAQLTTANGGKVLLFAPTVTNNGIITTPEGQTILAAGNKVYLQGSTDPAGFLVEVDSGGTATNLGKIVAERGNITMMGLAVNQSGTLSASTSVRANGSIHLLAQDTVTPQPGAVPLGARNGIVTLAKDSVTEVKPDLDNKEETIASQPFKTSEIKIDASLINIDGKVSAKGGNVTATNIADASPLLNSQNPRRIYLGSNAEIDVSGVDTVAPMSRNQIEAQLFSDQLKDAPILRDSGLFKETVYVDARKGTDLFDIAPFVALKGATTAEKMTKGGKVTLSTLNDIIVEKGSVINVSGGSTTYAAGQIKETNLSYNGKLVPISEAKAGLPYDKTADFIVDSSKKWGTSRVWDLSSGGTKGWGKVVPTNSVKSFLKTTTIGNQVDSYLEGDDAGTLDLTVPGDNQLTQNISLNGQLLANTKVGTEQIVNNTVPKGGHFIASANDLIIAKAAQALTDNFKFEDSLGANFKSSISTDLFTQGFNDIDLAKVTKITVNSEIKLKPDGQLTLSSKLPESSTQINANIIAPESVITFGAFNNTISDNVKISTAGTFTNNNAGVTGQYSQKAAVDGGNIKATILTLGKNITLDASAGASVNNDGSVVKGKAGDIEFTTVTAIDDSNKFTSYGFEKGGALSIAYGENGLGVNSEKTILNIAGNPNSSNTDFDVSANFFSKGGFSNIALSAFDINIGNNSANSQQILASAQTWRLNSAFANEAGGQAMSAVATPILEPQNLRSPVTVNLSAANLGGTLNLAENTAILTDRGGNVTLSAGKQVNILGDISTPSGNINITINDRDTEATVRPPFDATQAIFIGENASLSAKGTSITLPDSQANLLKSQVFNAGKISLDAPKGTVVIKDGAVLDVSGTSVVNDTKTITGFKRETLHGDAGTIKIGASDGLLLDGTFKGTNTGTGRAGTLEVGFTNTGISSGTPILSGNREFTITQQKQLQAENFSKGDTLKTSIGEDFNETSTDTIKGQISVEQIADGGFANLKVKSFLANDSSIEKNSIQLADKVDLKLAGNLTLETPLINVKDSGTAKLEASHITLKSLNTSVDNSQILSGEGKLVTQSKQLYLDGLNVVSGVKETSINTTQDITGQGNLTQNTEGGIKATGDINVTARQIYPNTDGKLTIEAVGENSTITVNSNGASAKPVLSAQGLLKLKAANISQRGVLTAPFGQINIEAEKSATFAAGSITSVSANNQNIPYSTTSTGGTRYDSKTGTNPKKTELIDKGVTIKADNTDLQKDAVIDLSAGGDMFAYEWVPGIGGSKDVLTQPNTYAIVPNLGQEYAAIDTSYSASSADVGVGKQIYITGVQGLASGNYTLLPARYALVPGAKMVQVDPNANNLLPGQTSPAIDGSSFTTGYFADIGTGSRDANWSTFKITDGSIFRPATGAVSKSPSQYLLTSATSFFSNPRNTDGNDINLPIDVAKLGLEANKLNLDANIVANKKAGGSGLNVDISSNSVRIVNAQDATDTESLQLTVGTLSKLEAESVLLGGSRRLENGITKVTTTAEKVTFESNNENKIQKPEIIATATNTITVKNGAVVNTGNASTKTGNLNLESSGEGSLLALSSINDISYSRKGGSANSSLGDLNIEAGSNLNAGKSVVLDATKSANLAGRVALQDGGSATLGANRILLGDAPANITGLNVDAAAISALGQLKSLALNSYNNIDTFGSVNFGNNDLNLTLDAAGIVGHLANGELTAPVNANPVSITAKNFTFKNTQSSTFTASLDASGRNLEINASSVKFDGNKDQVGKLAIDGFSNLNVKANEVRVANQGELNFNVAEATLNTGRVTADSGASYKLSADNKLNISPLVGAQIVTDKSVGAKLDIKAKDLTVASNVELLSGALSLTSTNDLNINNGAKLTAASSATSYYNVTQYANAGNVTLSSTNGNVNVNTGATVDVTSQGSANSGKVNILAKSGTANIEGDLKGNAVGSGKGGTLDVDVKTLSNLTVTNNKASGFNESRQYRVRTGDIAITGTGEQALIARDISVTADAGNINVSGDIIATAPKNSQIGIYANQNLTLASTAKIQANSTQAGAEGGQVELFTQQGALSLQNGSSINVAGGANGAGGKVHLRTPRIGAGSGNGVAVNALASAITGAKSTVLEAFKIFTGVTTLTTGTGTGATLGFATISNDVDSFMASKDSIVASLGKAGDNAFHLRAGTEVQSTSDLTISSDWNLYSESRTGDEPGVLTLRAANNLILNGSINDGFTTALSTGQIGTGDSWSYRLIAGMDFSSADILTTNVGIGNIQFNAAALPTTGPIATRVRPIRSIRTGSGDIDIATGGDLIMGPDTVIYTAGKEAPVLESFSIPSKNNPLYLVDGGDITINTKGNIIGGESQSNGRQLINQWMFRQGGGSADKDTTWWVRPDLFRQSLATMGGGDIDMRSGNDISNFSASVVTTGRFDNFDRTESTVDVDGNAVNTIIKATGNQSINGGGDISVVAGGNINNGVYYVAKGEGAITVGESIQKQGNTFGTVLALQDGSWNVNASKNSYIEAVINPTLVNQSLTNATQFDLTGDNAYFNSYSENAKVNITSLNGDIAFGGGSNIVSNVSGLTTAVSESLKYAPGQLSLVTHNGNVNFKDTVLLPSAKGDLKVLATNNVTMGNITMSDADLALLPNINNPVTQGLVNVNVLGSNVLDHSQQLLHKNNTDPVIIVAQNGNIDSTNPIDSIVLSKSTKLVAGQDINKLRLVLQNNNSSDVSLIKAGNDVKTAKVSLAGPGELLVQAGRNVDLVDPNVTTITTTGNAGNNDITLQDPSRGLLARANSALPKEGASITLQAGLGGGANVQGYIDRYISPTGAGPATITNDATKLAEYRTITANSVTEYIRKKTGNNTLKEAEALAQFNALDLESKTIFVNRHLTEELIESAKGFAKAGNHDRGNNAIASLFPTLNQGDILLFNSKVSTNSGGSIDLLAPGGLINVGVPGQGGDIGIITEKGGAIRGVADGDFSVNQSKVITQFGSDIAIWSTKGTIDAGRGSKTATSVPERIVQTDVDGNTLVEVRGVAAGSGIRAQSYDPDGPNGPLKEPLKGKVFLTAPTVDAGEAGIEAGDLLIVAPIVLNAANIQVQGASSGVPVAATGSIAGAGVSTTPDSVNAATSAVAQSVAQSVNQASLKPVLPSLIYVDVISIGD